MTTAVRTERFGFDNEGNLSPPENPYSLSAPRRRRRPESCGATHRRRGTRTPPSSSGLGYLVLSQETGVRFPVGVLGRLVGGYVGLSRSLSSVGRALRSHRRGRWFESSSDHSRRSCGGRRNLLLHLPRLFRHALACVATASLSLSTTG